MKRLIAFSLVLASLFATAAMAGEDLVIYSGRSDKFVKPVVKAFTEKTGIHVTLHSAKSTALLNKLRLEGERTEADLYLSNDAGNLQRGSDLGLFQPIPADLATRIPANYRASDNTWLGLSARARVLVVNTHSPLAKQLHSVFDLAKPELRGRIGITNSANESFIAGVTVYMLTAGVDATRDWLKGLQRNAELNVFNKHSKIVKAVAKGQLEVGLVNHYYIFRHLAKHPKAPVRILIPDQGPDDIGVAWNVAGIAISKYSHHVDAAQRFVDFVSSPEGQRIFAEVNREYPTRPGVPTAPEIPPADSIKVADVPMEKLGELRNATLDLLQEVDMP